MVRPTRRFRKGAWWVGGACDTVGRASTNGWSTVSLLGEALIVCGVAMDLVGAGVLSHAHNAESIAEIREEIGAEKSAVGEDDAIATHAQLLAEKRAGFFTLTVGLILYLSGLVIDSPTGIVAMAALATGVVVVVLIGTILWTRISGKRVERRARKAEESGGEEDLPEQ